MEKVDTKVMHNTVHELIHIRTPNHGSLWESYMNVYLPDWEMLDNKLKEVTRMELIF